MVALNTAYFHYLSLPFHFIISLTNTKIKSWSITNREYDIKNNRRIVW